MHRPRAFYLTPSTKIYPRLMAFSLTQSMFVHCSLSLFLFLNPLLQSEDGNGSTTIKPNHNWPIKSGGHSATSKNNTTTSAAASGSTSGSGSAYEGFVLWSWQWPDRLLQVEAERRVVRLLHRPEAEQLELYWEVMFRVSHFRKQLRPSKRAEQRPLKKHDAGSVCNLDEGSRRRFFKGTPNKQDFLATVAMFWEGEDIIWDDVE